MRGLSTATSSKKLWDRPILQQPFEWYFDPWMPQKWNEMVLSMREFESTKRCQSEHAFRMADPEEISKPQHFKHLYQSSEEVKWTHISVAASSILGGDENKSCTRAMWDRFEKSWRKTSQEQVKERLPWSRKEKGKGKEHALTKEDFVKII